MILLSNWFSQSFHRSFRSSHRWRATSGCSRCSFASPSTSSSSFYPRLGSSDISRKCMEVPLEFQVDFITWILFYFPPPISHLDSWPSSLPNHSSSHDFLTLIRSPSHSFLPFLAHLSLLSFLSFLSPSHSFLSFAALLSLSSLLRVVFVHYFPLACLPCLIIPRENEGI